MRDVVEAVAAQADDTVEALRELVRTPSVTGGETAAQAVMQRLMRQIGLDVEVYAPTRTEVEDHPSFSDDGLPLGDRPVVVGRTGPSVPTVVLNGHVDVVPTGDARRWRDDPWSAKVRDGAVWGRGSCDMKGGLAAGWAALRAIAATGRPLPVGVTFVSVIGEETGGVGTLSSILRGHLGDAAIVLEPTRGEICPVGSGALSFELEVEGVAAHGAMRRHGVSAIDAARPVLDALRHLEDDRHARFSHPLYGADTPADRSASGTLTAGEWLSTSSNTSSPVGGTASCPASPSKTPGRCSSAPSRARLRRTDGWRRILPASAGWRGSSRPRRHRRRRRSWRRSPTRTAT